MRPAQSPGLILLGVFLVGGARAAPREFPRPFPLQPPAGQKGETARNVPDPERKSSRCYQTYEALYSHAVTEFRVVFGYKDARPARFVGDRYEKNALVEALLKPCAGSFAACGFTPDPDDADLFWRDIPGPDGLPRTVRLQVISSSVGPDDDENREDPFQERQSEAARRVFLDGLDRAQVVLYDGHSRDGGGPDFDPPRLGGDRHVDYDWYSRNKRGISSLVDELEPTGPLRLLGFFSCLSDRFVPEVLSARPQLGLITSPRLLYYAEALRDMLGTLSALLTESCRSDFDSALRAESNGGHSHLQGFFRADPAHRPLH